MNVEVAFVLEWDDEEGKALLSLDDGEREIVSTSWEWVASCSVELSFRAEGLRL
jgi:hypothetical protein